MKNLARILKEAGHEPIVLQDKMMVLPFGGRILGLYPYNHPNVFWVNQNLQSEESSRTFLKGEGWLNIGGDRTWISPEIETNVGDPARTNETYDVPKSIDPANYEVVASDRNTVTLETAMNVLFQRSRSNLKLNVVKQVSLNDTPPVELPNDVLFAGYVLKTTLTAESELSDSMRPAIWNLIQVPGNGQILIPVRPGVQPRAFIGKPVLSVDENLITCDVKTSASFKFSIRASRSKGLMLYYSGEGKPASMVVRRFAVRDESLYADVPCDDPTDAGYVQQVYVDDGNLGGFGELEYHSPAIHKDRQHEVEDLSDVWAFVGPEEGLHETGNAIIEQVVP